MFDFPAVYDERPHCVRRAGGQIANAQVYGQISAVVFPGIDFLLPINEVDLNVVVLRDYVYEVQIDVLHFEFQGLGLRQRHISVLEFSFLELVERYNVISVFRQIPRKSDLFLVLAGGLELKEREERAEIGLDLFYDKLRGMILKRFVVWIVFFQDIPYVIVVEELMLDCVVVLSLEPVLANRIQYDVVEVLREMTKL